MNERNSRSTKYIAIGKSYSGTQGNTSGTSRTDCFVTMYYTVGGKCYSSDSRRPCTCK